MINAKNIIKLEINLNSNKCVKTKTYKINFIDNDYVYYKKNNHILKIKKSELHISKINRNNNFFYCYYYTDDNDSEKEMQRAIKQAIKQMWAKVDLYEKQLLQLEHTIGG